MKWNIVVDRSKKKALLAIGATLIAFLLSLPLYSADVTQVSDFFLVGLGGALLIIMGFASTSRCRPISQRTGAELVRLSLLTLLFGGLLGLANLGANYGLGMLDQSIYDLLAQRFSDLPSWGSVLAAPVVEEIVLRLFFMGVVAWVAARFIDDSHKTFLIALWFSAIVFGLLHTFRPLPDSSPFDIIYAVGIAIKSGAATFLLGWIFWKWGLPYAILCHAIANVVHRLAEPMLF